MLVIPVVVHKFILTAQVSKLRSCAQCSQEFVHHGEIRVVGSHRTIFGLFATDSQEQARLNAEDRWPRKLKKWNPPALCPHCDEFQPDMFDAMRADRRFWLKIVGAALIFPSSMAAILSPFLAFSDNLDRDGVFILLALMAIASCSPIVFIFRSVSNSFFNPNILSRSRKEKLVKARASKVEEWTIPIGVRKKRYRSDREMEYA